MKLLFVGFILSLLSGCEACKGQAKGDDTDLPNIRAFNLILKQYTEAKKIKSEKEIMWTGVPERFLIQAFTNFFSRRDGSNSKTMYDSLCKVNDKLNATCVADSVNLDATLSTSNESPKYIIFFSRNCNQILQVYVYEFSPQLRIKDYLLDYYGEFESYLFEFANKEIKKYYRTIIFGN